MVKIKNLKKEFNNNVLFDKFNLVVPDNEFVIITGKSGSGKTTLLNMIGGIEEFSEGTIEVNGYVILPHKKVKRLYYQKTIGFLFQNYALVENKTVYQNLKMINPKFRTDISINKALEKVNLLEKINKHVYTLSGGEQQRIALARLMLKQCEVILIDEPTASLDWSNTLIVMDMIKEIHRLKKTIIMVTHDTRLFDLAERVIEI
ncbi:MAG: ATP-binding cassette domain-containing protein [Ruminococcus sp.]|nr:ATP-binding cassette domain-containing protein [Ruminococcus sp.]